MEGHLFSPRRRWYLHIMMKHLGHMRLHLRWSIWLYEKQSCVEIKIVSDVGGRFSVSNQLVGETFLGDNAGWVWMNDATLPSRWLMYPSLKAWATIWSYLVAPLNGVLLFALVTVIIPLCSFNDFHFSLQALICRNWSFISHEPFDVYFAFCIDDFDPCRAWHCTSNLRVVGERSSGAHPNLFSTSFANIGRVEAVAYCWTATHWRVHFE